MVRHMFADETVSKVLAMPHSRSRSVDEGYWPHSSTGDYNVKSGYGVLFTRFMELKGSVKDRTRVDEEGKSFCKRKLWKLPGPMMWKILIWQIVTNSLPVGSNFERRKIEVDTRCKLCTNEEMTSETLEHLFRDCEVAKRIWACTELGIRDSQAVLEINKGEEMTNSATSGMEDEKMLWLKESKPFYTIGSMYNCECIRVMVYAGWKSRDKAGVGWVAFTKTGAKFFEISKAIKAESAMQAEALGLREVIYWARDKGLWHLEVSSDCLPLIAFFVGIERAHHLTKEILADIIFLSALFHCVSFSYIPRSFNFLAHGLACKAMLS
ncbi:uncharacterized protein LOC141616971 [Silene latifolia]|uniref:uncharacterized protein LOC141616971 n=1 Tax=Silene latifolia TaxID=37657 RepID=UPI003D771AC6